MSLRERLTADMKAAMKARNKPRLSTIRLLLSAIQNLEIKAKEPLTEAEELSLLTRQAKQRNESIDAFVKGGATERADLERAELQVIQEYLPEQMTKEAVVDIVKAAIAAVGAESKRDMGKVMGKVMPQTKGRFPGKDVRPIVEGLLS